MVRKPGATAVQVQAWLAYENRRREVGASLWAIAGELASKPGTDYCQATIYYYLAPAAREKVRQYRRGARRRYLQEYRSRTLQSKRRYERAYRRIARPRSQERILHELYVGSTTLTLTQIADALPSLKLIGGVKFQQPTIERRLLEGYLDNQAKGCIRGPPPYLALVDAETRTWYFANEPPASVAENADY